MSEQVSRSAGSAFGGFFNNPGIVAIAALGIGLFIFREPIIKALSGLGGSLSNLFSPAGAIQAAGAEAGQFVFNLGQGAGQAVFGAGQEAGQAVFEAGQQAGQAVFGAGQATGDFIGAGFADIQQQIDNFFKVQQSNFDIFTSNTQKDIDEALAGVGQFGGEQGENILGFFQEQADKFNNLFSGSSPTVLTQEQIDQANLAFQLPGAQPTTFTDISQLPPSTLDPDRPLDLFQFAQQFGITPVEAFKIEKGFGGLDFEAIAAIPTFGEILAENPNLTASQIADLKFQQAGGGGDFDFGTNTGLALELAGASFGSDVFLQKEDPGFALLKEAEALAAMESLGGFVQGGLFANPDFPITLGESFLGKAGTVVSPSISNLTDKQLKDFIEQFG